MKRLILCSALALFLFSSCDSPVNNLNGDRQQSATPDNLSSQIPPGTAPAQADSIRKAAFQQFKSQHGSQWRVTWNDKTGLPLTVFSGTTEPVRSSPEQSARTFLGQHQALFGMRGDLADLQLIEVDISQRGNRHVRFQQTYKGVPVYDATYQVHIRPGGRIDMANGHYYPGIEVSTSPSVPAASAIQAAEADLGGDRLKEDPETELMIVRNPETEAFALAWRVMISEMGLHWQYFVDAASGQVLEKLEMATDITGDGDIITETSCTTPNPANRNLYRLNGSGNLEGTYANVHNEEASRAFSSVNSFQYAADNTHFEEVNVYYHIDIFRNDYMNTIGFAGENIGSDQDLEAFVHDPDFLAAYIFSQEAVRFGDPPDFALQDEVIYHEFTHAAADAINGSHRLDPNRDEEGAIGEGTADYFPGSHTGDAQIGNCVLVTPRDMENPGIATYDQYLNDFQAPNVEEHRGGEFFSAVLWDLRNDGGISVQEADEIIFEAIRRLSGSPTFIEYRDAMMAVDSDVNGGVNNDLIQDTFANRGIGEPVVLEVTISGPGTLEIHQQGTWTASAENTSGSVSYQWYYTDSSTGSWIPDGTDSNTYSHSFSFTSTSAGDTGVRVDITSGSEQATDTLPVFVTSGDCDPLTEICMN